MSCADDPGSESCRKGQALQNAMIVALPAGLGGGMLIAATPELAEAAQVAIRACAGNVVLCLNNAGIMTSETIVPGGVGAGGAIGIGKTSLTATADTGHAAVIADGKLTGEGDNALMLQATTASANPAVDISGNSDISNSSVKGESKGAGAAVKQSGTTTMTNAGVTGTAVSGSGVEVGGRVTLDEATAKGLKAGSGSGSGLALSEGADVHVVQDGTVTPVTTAVVLEGTSGSGNAVTVDGNAAISGVILKGETASESGAGVALKNGRLELSDNLAGVEAGSSGMGTALLMENAVLDGKGYRESGMGDYALRPEVSGDGTGFHALGDNELRSVVVEVLSRGKGSALKVENGTLSSDKRITAMNTGAGGTALMLDGGAIVGVGDRPVPVTLNASGEGGIALDVAAGKENALRNVLVKIIPPQETLARILLQDGVNAQTSSLTREVQEKYPEPLKDTMISVCTREDGCQSWSLNVSHPSAE